MSGRVSVLMEDTGIDIKYVAELARLELSDEQAAKLQSELGSIVGYIAELKAVNVDNIEPTAHATMLSNAWREDEVSESYPRAEMLANAPGVVEDGLIKLPKVMPGEEE